MNSIFANYLWTMFWGSVFWIFWIMWFSPRKYKYRCIRVYVWFKDDKHVIWMWIWLILKNISLLDRIWSLWLTRHQTSYSGSAGWYFRYQSIHIQITYTFLPQNNWNIIERGLTHHNPNSSFGHGIVCPFLTCGLLSLF